MCVSGGEAPAHFEQLSPEHDALSAGAWGLRSCDEVIFRIVMLSRV